MYTHKDYVKKLIYFAFIIYALGVVFIYTVGTDSLYINMLYSRNNSYSIEMFNFIPFNNIVEYTKNMNYYNTNIIIHNLIFPLVIWIPLGVFVNICKIYTSIEIKSKVVVFAVAFTFLMLIRTIFLIGFFDIDKVILATFGFYIGLFISEKLNYNLKNV